MHWPGIINVSKCPFYALSSHAMPILNAWQTCYIPYQHLLLSCHCSQCTVLNSVFTSFNAHCCVIPMSSYGLKGELKSPLILHEGLHCLSCLASENPFEEHKRKTAYTSSFRTQVYWKVLKLSSEINNCTKSCCAWLIKCKGWSSWNMTRSLFIPKSKDFAQETY